MFLSLLFALFIFTRNKETLLIFICFKMSRNVVKGIFIAGAVKGLPEKVRAVSDGEGVKFSGCRGQVCNNDDNTKRVRQ
jgi:hypothetical protein